MTYMHGLFLCSRKKMRHLEYTCQLFKKIVYKITKKIMIERRLADTSLKLKEKQKVV